MNEPTGPVVQLTRREYQALCLRCEGLTYEQAAERIGLVGHTLRQHLSRAFARMGIEGEDGGAKSIRACRMLWEKRVVGK